MERKEVIFLIIGTIAVILYLGLAYLSRWKCFSKYDGTGIPVRWGFSTGCEIKDEKQGWMAARAMKGE